MDYEQVVVLFEDAEVINNETIYSLRGTGFTLVDTSTRTSFVITNNHVLEGRDSIFVRFNTADGKAVRKCALLITGGQPRWISHSDTNIDLAIIPTPLELPIRGWRIERLKPLAETYAGDAVYFIGFPLGAYAGQEKNYPVVRSGIVAFISREDVFSLFKPDKLLLQKDMILLDGVSLHGNSGSPVISYPREDSDDLLSIIGVVRARLKDLKKEEIDLDLAVVIPADRIIELIEDYKNIIK
jgi:S1-C subfamily serine protease